MKQNFAQAVYDVVRQTSTLDHPAILDEMNSVTAMSSPYVFWDLLNTNLVHTNLKNTLYGTGSWKTCYFLIDGVLCSFMKEKRFEYLVKKKKLPQYLKSVLQLNKCLPLIQSCLFPELEPTASEKKIVGVICDLLGAKIDEIKSYSLVVFNATTYGVSTLKEVLLDKNFDVISEENLLEKCQLAVPADTSDSETKSPLVKVKDNLKKVAGHSKYKKEAEIKEVNEE